MDPVAPVHLVARLSPEVAAAHTSSDALINVRHDVEYSVRDGHELMTASRNAT